MELLQEVAQMLTAIKEKRPLIHHLTNYVTANDSANITLAIGASPVMADDAGEAVDMVAMAAALVLNIGTLSAPAVDSMLAAGKKAEELGIPIIFDPVGTGATPLRSAAAERIIRGTRLAVMKGNHSEIKALSGHKAGIKGVDSTADETDADAVATGLARRLGLVVAVTGRTDVVAGGDRLCRIHNGHPWLASVTGTGCMTASLVGCACGAGADPYVGAVAGITFMGIAGELAYKSLRSGEGIGSFRVRLFDAIFTMTPETVRQYARIN